MGLQKMSSNENHLATATKRRLEEIRQHCSEITSDVQLLSHELHSAKLDYLGISTAIRGFCREFAEHQEVSVEFTARDVPKSVSRDESLCLFRVTQEALHNAVKHSGVDRFWVEHSGAGNEIRLEVKDAGIGFDVKEANRIGGLGLVSMQERVRAVDGRFYIESKSGSGTKIIVSVPARTSVEKLRVTMLQKYWGQREYKQPMSPLYPLHGRNVNLPVWRRIGQVASRSCLKTRFSEAIGHGQSSMSDSACS
jgi:signal transduction histidine kinase